MRKRKTRSMVTSLKDICKCGKSRGAAGLSYAPGEMKYGRTMWVCAECLLPKKTYAEAYIKRCGDCLDEFSSPWEEICEKCHRIQHSDIKLVEGRVLSVPLPDSPEWKGWVWGREQQRSGEARARQERRRAAGKESET